MGSLEILPIGFDDLWTVGSAHAKEVGVSERQAHLGSHEGGFVPGTQQPNLRNSLRLFRSGKNLMEGMVVGLRIVQVVDDVADLLGEMADVLGHGRVGEGRRSDLVAARSAPEAEVDAVGIERVEYSEGFGNLQGTVVGEHDTAGTDPDALGVSGDLAHHDLGSGASEVGQIVVLGYPITLVAHLLGGGRELDGLTQRDTGIATFTHRRLIDHAQLQFLAQVVPLTLDRIGIAHTRGIRRRHFCITKNRVVGKGRLTYYKYV